MKRMLHLLLVISMAATCFACKSERIELCTKSDTITCDEDPGYLAEMRYAPAGKEFNYRIKGTVPVADVDYQLVYYKDMAPDWGNVECIGAPTTAIGNDIAFSECVELGKSLPEPDDDNYPGGAKIWIVPTDRVNCGTGSLKDGSWHPEEYLMEQLLILYVDTDTI